MSTPIETKKIWLFDHARQDAVEVDALNIDGQWHYIKNDFVNPLYGSMHETRYECLRAELAREETHHRNQERRIQDLKEKLAKIVDEPMILERSDG